VPRNNGQKVKSQEVLGMKKIFIGVAWPYANGPLHLGHIAGCYLGADIFSRFHRLRGDRVLMVSGSDQHGTPITVTAEKEGVPPSAIAERYHEMNSQTLKDLRIEFDIFTKTSTEEHRKEAQDFFMKLMENGYIYEKETVQLYCPHCKKYLPDRYIEGICPHCGYEKARGDQCDNCGKILDPLDLKEPRCQICGTTPEPRSTDHMFFRLSALEERLTQFVEERPYWRPSVKNFTHQWLKSGLHDRAVTRDIKWGIPVPLEGWEEKSLYVWFEAVMGYLTASISYSKMQDKPDLWREFWDEGTDAEHYYFLGKDNIPFHTILWPAMLMAHDGLKLPDNVVANQYLKFGGEQFSKSRGVSIEAAEVLKKFSPDQIRYYLAASMPENRDTEFTWKDFERRINTELVNALGNYIHRVLTFTYNNFGYIPERGELSEEDRDALKVLEKTMRSVEENLEKAAIKDSIAAIIEMARFGNNYMSRTAPWALIKEDRERCGTVMNVNLSILKALGIMIAPFLPDAAEQTLAELGVKNIKWDEALLPPKAGHKVKKPAPLFQKVSIETESFPGFETLDLRSGNVISVEDHPDADKLYVLRVDLGEKEPRTLVAGLKPFYSPEELLGKTLIILSNLEPAKLRGIKSEGMLLAADYETDGGEVVAFLTPEKRLPPGTPINSGMAQGRKRIKYRQFSSLSLKIGRITDRNHADIGGEIVEIAPHRIEAGKKVAIYIEERENGPKGLVIGTAEGTPIVPEKDIAEGARIR